MAAHALVLAWTFGRSMTQGDGARSTPIELSEVEVAVEPPAAAPPPPVPPPAEGPRASPQPNVASNPAPPRSTTPASASPSPVQEDVPSTPVVRAEPGGDGTWTFTPTKPGGGAGGVAAVDSTSALGHATAAGVGAVLAEAQRKAEDRGRKPLIFTSRDLDLGLAPGGQYVSLARDRVRNSLVPQESHALLEFWTDKRGLVARVRVLDASSDPRAWADAANALVEDAHSAYPLKIPSNADGLIVTLDVKSVLQTLSGASPNQSGIAKAISAIQNPVDAVLDSKVTPVRIVAAKVVQVEEF